MNEYQVIGLMTKWEVQRVPEWRGYEIVGSNEAGDIVKQFLPDAAIRVLVEEFEKPAQGR
jgi:hypothetical protein